jgi:pimeloyl-ACP methyl ester carboxylesterase
VTGAGERTTQRRWAVVAGVVLAVAASFVALAPLGMRPGRERLATVDTPASRGLAFEPVAFRPPDQPITLRGWWIPAARPKAAIIVVHGGGPDNRSVPYGGGLDLMRDLVARDYAVLALDLRNYGESDASADGGVTFGDDEAFDVIGAVEHLAAHHPGLRVGALGFSMGGQAVLQAAAREPRLAAVATDSTFADARSIAPRFAHAATGLPGWLVAPVLWSAEHLHGIPLDRGRAIDVVGRIAPRPVLIIHNAGDPIVPLSHAERLLGAIGGATIWVTPIPLAGTPASELAAGRFGTHIKSYLLDPAGYVARVTAFFDRAVGAGDAPTRDSTTRAAASGVAPGANR